MNKYTRVTLPVMKQILGEKINSTCRSGNCVFGYTKAEPHCHKPREFRYEKDGYCHDYDYFIIKGLNTNTKVL